MTADRQGPTEVTAVGDPGDGQPLSAMPVGSGLIAATAAAETMAVLATVWLFRSSLSLLVIIHLLAAFAMIASVVHLHRHGREMTYPMLAMLALIATGPIGGFGALVIAWLSRRRARDSRLLTDWYERIAMSVAIDPVARFCGNVSSGRTIDLGAEAPPSYAAVIAGGTLEERQNVLGIIARRYHPDYLAVLAQALRSPEPVIRVQAAAVAAHVRPDIAKQFRDLVGRLEAISSSGVETLGLLHTLESMIGSGLLDEGDRRHAVDLVSRLGDVVLSRLAGGETLLPRTAPLEERAALEDTLERLLLQRGRFAEFRLFRSERRALQARPMARIRRVTQHRTRAAGAAA